MPAAKKPTRPADPSPDNSGDGAGDAASVPGKRRPLIVNVPIDGVWYGPAWGNADKYPADAVDGRDELFEE